MCPRGGNDRFPLRWLLFTSHLLEPERHIIYIRRKASQRPRRNARSCLAPGPWARSLAPGSYMVSAAATKSFFHQNWRTGRANCRERGLQMRRVPTIPMSEGGGLGGYSWASFEGFPPECQNGLYPLYPLYPFGSLYPLYPFEGPMGLPCILFYQAKGSTNHKKDTKDTRDTWVFGILAGSSRNSSKSNHLNLRSGLGGFGLVCRLCFIF